MLRRSINIPLFLKCVELTNLSFRTFLRSKGSIAPGSTIDVLDCFIDNLMISKVNKWRNKQKVTHCDNFRKSLTESKLQLEEPIEITKASVDDYILKNFNSSKLTSILSVCLNKRICPSRDIIAKLAHSFARCGNTEFIDLLISLSRVDGIYDEKEQEVYRIYKAEAIWRNGESCEKSLNILWEIYEEQPALRRQVRTSLRVLFAEVVLNRGEASLMQAKNFVLKLASHPFEDYLPLSFLWARCVLSECYADQELAAELVEECKENELFKKAVGSRVDSVIGESFSRHQMDAVYRLLEALLKLSMKDCSQHVLEKLFDYKYLLGDIEGCDAVLEACDALELDVGYTRRKELEKAKSKKLNPILHWKKQHRKTDDFKDKLVPKFRLKL